jgi:hypothetical protein
MRFVQCWKGDALGAKDYDVSLKVRGKGIELDAIGCPNGQWERYCFGLNVFCLISCMGGARSKMLKVVCIMQYALGFMFIVSGFWYQALSEKQ